MMSPFSAASTASITAPFKFFTFLNLKSEILNLKPDLIIDGGELPKNLSSTIVDLTKKPYRILRRGKSSILVQKTLERISA